MKRPQQPYDLEILDTSQLQVDTSSSDSESGAATAKPSGGRGPSRPSHGRSLSHPFPSLFATWKKKSHHGNDQQQQQPGAGASGGANGTEDSDSSGDEMGMPKTERSSSSSRQPRDERRPAATPRESEYLSGSCMTCGTLLRWPKHLGMFKCTVCVTINDVRPMIETLRPDGPPRANIAMQAHSTFPQMMPRQRGVSEFILGYLRVLC